MHHEWRENETNIENHTLNYNQNDPYELMDRHVKAYVNIYLCIGLHYGFILFSFFLSFWKWHTIFGVLSQIFVFVYFIFIATNSLLCLIHSPEQKKKMFNHKL